jgi:hypothetical protein
MNNFVMANAKMEQLKIIARRNNLKVSGNKAELKQRIQQFILHSASSIKIQSWFRGYLQRLFVSLCGPATMKRSLCTNDCDFVTLDDICRISPYQFFSYKDRDGFIYGFDIISLQQMISTRETKVLNPYTRREIPSQCLNDIETIFGFHKIMGIEISLPEKYVPVSQHKTIEFRALTLFQNIDALGNYTDYQWFLSLQTAQLHMFLRELKDLFNYRLQLTIEKKREICPPLGNPFSDLPVVIHGIDDYRGILLSVMERFVNSGINHDSRCLGALYILSALTIVSHPAAQSLPWLYQSTIF